MDWIKEAIEELGWFWFILIIEVIIGLFILINVYIETQLDCVPSPTEGLCITTWKGAHK